MASMSHFVNVKQIGDPPIYVNILNIITVEPHPTSGTIVRLVGGQYIFTDLDCDTVIKAICLQIEAKPPFS